ncbi:MAG: PA-phosphatase [Bacteroidetes bacterium]|nr:PA-phosphatase [Bacteroidota bacterium]MDA1269153.1 PA-phosphatase [Bacteroidota bacterium]
MVRKLALLLSVVFQPLLMPSLVFGLVFFGIPQASSIPESFKIRLFYLIVSATLLIPIILMLGLRWSGLVKSLHFEEKSDRRFPFLLITFFYVLTTYFLKQKTELDPILWQGMGAITVAVALLTAVTFFWKISAHMTGIGGLLAVLAVLALYFPSFQVAYLLVTVLVLGGLVASSRLYLDAHSPAEVYAGLLVGFVTCWIGFSWIYG